MPGPHAQPHVWRGAGFCASRIPRLQRASPLFTAKSAGLDPGVSDTPPSWACCELEIKGSSPALPTVLWPWGEQSNGSRRAFLNLLVTLAPSSSPRGRLRQRAAAWIYLVSRRAALAVSSGGEKYHLAPAPNKAGLEALCLLTGNGLSPGAGADKRASEIPGEINGFVILINVLDPLWKMN